MRLNDLRHYVATQLLGKGVDVITVAERLGHEATVTQRVYAGWIAEIDQAAGPLLTRARPSPRLSIGRRRLTTRVLQVIFGTDQRDKGLHQIIGRWRLAFHTEQLVDRHNGHNDSAAQPHGS